MNALVLALQTAALQMPMKPQFHVCALYSLLLLWNSTRWNTPALTVTGAIKSEHAVVVDMAVE